MTFSNSWSVWRLVLLTATPAKVTQTKKSWSD